MTQAWDAVCVTAFVLWALGLVAAATMKRLWRGEAFTPAVYLGTEDAKAVVVEYMSRKPLQYLKEWEELRDGWAECKRQHEANIKNLGEMRGKAFDQVFPGMIDAWIAGERRDIEKCEAAITNAEAVIAHFEKRLRQLRSM